MEESKKCQPPECTSAEKGTSKGTKRDTSDKKYKFRWTVSSGDIEHLNVRANDALLKRKSGYSSSAPALGRHSYSHRKEYLKDDPRVSVGKLPCLRQTEGSKSDASLRSSMTESTILEEEVPVIVRRRGCTLRVRITSITDEDIAAFEKECVS